MQAPSGLGSPWNEVLPGSSTGSLNETTPQQGSDKFRIYRQATQIAFTRDLTKLFEEKMKRSAELLDPPTRSCSFSPKAVEVGHSEKERRARLLEKAKIPLRGEELEKVLEWVDSLQKLLREKKDRTYPAQFSDGVHVIEAHSPEELYLYFPQSEDPEKFIMKTYHKEIRYTWLLTAKPKRFVYLTSELDPKKDPDPALNEQQFLILFNDHPYSAKIHKLFYYDETQVILMKDYKNRDLLSILQKLALEGFKIRDEQKLQWAEEILTIVDFLHSQNVVHRDIKPENLFVTGKMKLVLGDYGFAHLKDDECAKKLCGSLPYCAYETLTRTYQEDPASLDIWSVGCVLYILFSEKNFPWFRYLVREPMCLSKAIRAMEIFNQKNNPSPETQPLFYLVRTMLDIDKSKRPSIHEALEAIKTYRAAHSEDNLTNRISHQFPRHSLAGHSQK